MPDTLVPYHLTCESRTTPMGLDERAPRLSWKLADPRAGQGQTAYRLTIATEAAEVAEVAEVYDSGVVASADTLNVVPAGLAVEPATRYRWTVTVWDADGMEGGTASSWFETGLLGAAGWAGASWIEHDPVTDPVADPPTFGEPLPERLASSAPVRLFRRVFAAADRPVRARLYVTARGLYRPFLNGVRVGDAELAPGWTDYRHRVQYQTYDVTDLVAAGENVLGAQVADGWWSGYVGFDRRRHAEHYGVRPRFVARLVVEYAGGGRDVVVTDGSWRETASHILHADLLMGEVADARLEPAGWDGDPGFDDTGWQPVAVAGEDHDTLIGMLDEPVRVLADLSPVRVTRLPGDRVLADLGQNMVGRVRLSLRGARPGAKVTVRHAEVLDDAGELYVRNLRSAEATDVYFAKGGAEEVFEPAFTVHGFRYVEITGHTDVEVTGRVMHSDTPFVGEFTCSDPLIDRLWSNIRWGQRGNFVSVPTDCPQRDERLGWLADAQVFLPTACYNADVSAFFARWMRDVLDGRLPGGAFPDVAPVLDRSIINREGAPGWGDAGVLIPWHLYRVYGDRRTLERAFPAMAGWVDWIAGGNPDLIWRRRVGNHYGDWLQIDAETPREVLATAYFARSAAVVARAAEALGRGDDAARYGELAGRIGDAFRAAFVTADGAVRGDTQTGQLLALAFDLLPAHLVEPAVARLVADIRGRGDRLTTGFLGVALLCPVLTRYGRADVAHALLRQTEYPSWLYSIAHGATTIWERWDGWTGHAGFQAPEMNSFNHYALGSVGEWLYSRVAGIDQAADSIAYDRLVIAPVPGDSLTSAAARFESPRGLVATEWTVADGVFRLAVTVPPGVRAVVLLPGDDTRHEVGSGTHEFTAAR
ncbi:alpha-L-rhamnosidase [Microtetraspora sp. NBRC 13810]|uniref:alpha-L-rhamnosidase n=1 Tax=Microtetraspora sp. NBRC 13810 TaxID=3030990 RepID=UPI0024A03875|nr:alpha-L-rhamnosidase [Microtetraspora sp. NBRC 13810]GLW11933.1 alpha-L-rhamnosidase [Microtetraspora sp. NBRC 13810]